MTLLLMMIYGMLALMALAAMSATMLGIVAIHRTFVARHEAAVVPVGIDTPDAPAGA